MESKDPYSPGLTPDVVVDSSMLSTRHGEDHQSVELQNSVDSKRLSYRSVKEAKSQESRLTVDTTIDGQDGQFASTQNLTAEAAGNEAGEEEDLTKYPHGITLWILTISLMLAVLVMAMDNLIIATAVPTITTEFDSLNDVGWYASAYMLFAMALQPVYGRIYTFYTIKWTYVAAILIFEVGSIVLATSKSSPVFILGRAIAGVGGAGIFSGSIVIIGHSVPLKSRPKYLGFVTSMYGVASIAGPLLGGVFTDTPALTWRFCFWINLPIGGLALILLIIFLKDPPKDTSQLNWKQKLAQMDLVGASTLTASLLLLLLVLQWGGIEHPWSDSRVWGLIIGTVLLLAIFAGIQWRLQDRATIPPRVISQRTVLACCIYTTLSVMVSSIHAYYLPFYFQAVMGTSAQESGVRSLPYLLSNTLASMVVGVAVSILGFYVPFMWLASSLATIGSGLIYTLWVDSPAGQWIGYQILTGAGVGMGAQIPFTAVQVVLPKEDMAVGSSLVGFFMLFGAAVSVSIGQNIFSNFLSQRMTEPGLDAASIVVAGPTNYENVVPSSSIILVKEAYNFALQKTFIFPIAVAGVAFIVSFFVQWGNVKKVPKVTGDDEK